jgi:hypothetical protein
MEENEQEALRRKEDKDYGFPFVEAKPLAAPEPSRPIVTHNVGEKSSDTAAEAELFSTGSFSDPIALGKKVGKKRSQTPLLITLVVLLVSILAAMAYFLYFSTGEQPTAQQTISQPIEVVPEPIVPQISTDTVAMELQIEEQQVSEPQNEAQPPLSTQPTQSPSGELGQLYLVESKGEKAAYHLIVASLPNERVAREEAQVFLNNGRDIWMIFPSGDTKNYRLSVGTFGSFKSASDALPQAKIDFGGSTWILKY